MTYKFRNLPCTCTPKHLLYSVEGEYVNINTGEALSGVLEWCTSLEDATERLKIMSKFPEFSDLKVKKDLETAYTVFEITLENLDVETVEKVLNFFDSFLKLGNFKGSMTVEHRTEDEVLAEVEDSSHTKAQDNPFFKSERTLEELYSAKKFQDFKLFMREQSLVVEDGVKYYFTPDINRFEESYSSGQDLADS